MGKNFFRISNLNLPSFSLQPFPLVLVVPLSSSCERATAMGRPDSAAEAALDGLQWRRVPVVMGAVSSKCPCWKGMVELETWLPGSG